MGERSDDFVVLRGGSPIVLVAPHGGLRDHAAVPWGSRPLRMNDVATGALTRTLGAALDAAAVINEGVDRNLVDLNRISAASRHAPRFLDALGDLVTTAIARHGRAVVLAIHGWNVGEPIVDCGFGFAPTAASLEWLSIGDHFRDGPLAAFRAACAERAIRATLGARYPARGRENLIQLFSGRHRADPRPPIGALAELSDAVDAVQLELAIPLRLPGMWRDRLVDACRAWTATTRPGDRPRPSTRITATSPIRPEPPEPSVSCTVQLAGSTLSALARSGPTGALLLLLPPDGSLIVFTGERVDPEAHRDGVGGFAITERRDGRELSYRGPCVRFPDTTAFADLERHLVHSDLVETDVRFTWTADDAGFGTASGTATIDGIVQPMTGSTFSTAAWPPPARGVRLAVRLPAATVRLDTTGATPDGAVTRGDRATGIVGATVDRAGRHLQARMDLADGTTLDLSLEVERHLPLVPNVPAPHGAALLALCRNGADGTPVGWAELRDAAPPPAERPGGCDGDPPSSH